MKKPVVRSKWEGEDEDESGPVVSMLLVLYFTLLLTNDRADQSDWEESSDEEEEKPKAAPVAPPKKKGTLKAKLAEKAAEKAAHAGEEDDIYDEDAVLDPREKARRDRERELNADLSNAAELLGAAALGGTRALILEIQFSYDVP